MGCGSSSTSPSQPVTKAIPVIPPPSFPHPPLPPSHPMPSIPSDEIKQESLPELVQRRVSTNLGSVKASHSRKPSHSRTPSQPGIGGGGGGGGGSFILSPSAGVHTIQRQHSHPSSQGPLPAAAHHHHRRHSSQFLKAPPHLRVSARLDLNSPFLSKEEMNQRVEDLFHEYVNTEKHDGMLHHAEIRQITERCIDEFITVYSEHVEKEAKGRLSKEELAKHIAEDLPYLLGGGKDKNAWIHSAEKYLWSHLDITGKGKISRNEFVMRFGACYDELFSVEHKEKRTENASLTCILM